MFQIDLTRVKPLTTIIAIESPAVRVAGYSRRAGAFTLVELLVVIAIVGILASLVIPSLSRARSRGQSIYCLNNLRQLGLALQVYVAENDDLLPFNMGTEGTRKTIASGEFLNWANNVMSWELDADNTNTTWLAAGGLGPMLSGNTTVFRCPSDNALSAIQRQAGWSARVRSYSMNAMLGNAGEFLAGGVNTNNPGYKQFFTMSEVPNPSEIFAFVEEHPDSINDGYFINRFYTYEWHDLPASFHNDGANFAFADGHAEFRAWRHGSTRPPPLPDAANLPFRVRLNERADLNWVLSRTSVSTRPPVTTPSYY